jgi:hypothetical protein
MPARITLFSLLISASISFSQSSNDLMVGGAFDFIKTDIDNILEKAQIGFEVNYFVVRKFTITAGAEFWTDADESFVFGSRYYFTDNFFARARGIIGENDFALGGGMVIPIQNNWRWESMADFYFEGELAIRTGVAYVIPLKK